MIFYRLLCFFYILLATPAVFAADRYVSPTGNNGNDGSFSNPWETVQYAIDQLQPGDLPSVWPLDHDEEIAARTAASSLRTPRAKDAIRLDRAGGSRGPRREMSLSRSMAWNSATRVLASTKAGTPSSTAARVLVSALDSLSRCEVINGAMVRAEGTRRRFLSLAWSARRRRVAHSPTTRREPRKPC